MEFPLKDSLCNFNVLIENLFSHDLQGFQICCFGYHDLITEWLEQYYLESSVTNDKLQPFLMFSKNENTNECTSTSGLKGLYVRHFKKQGKA